MAGSGARNIRPPASKNPFFDEEEDVDDETFLQNAPTRNSGWAGNSAQARSQETSSAEERRQQLLLEKQKIEERTLQSSSRAKGMLYETEKVGIATAEDLIRQREQLERTDTRLDAMNNSLRTSEKHIQNIKSIFSSFTNYFTKPDPATLTPKKKEEGSAPPVSGSASASGLSRIVDEISTSSLPSSSNTTHPALRVRGLEEEPQHKPYSNVDQQLEEDLGEMSAGLSRLKGLAQGLTGELEDQNRLIDRLQTSTDKADWRIQRQNKDMERILKK